MAPSPHGRTLSRRAFLLGAAGGLAAGAGGAWIGRRAFTGRSVEVPRPGHAMPGPFPGRVVEVHHPEAIRPDQTIDAPSVRAMMHQGMCALTGADHPGAAWRRFFER